MHPDPLDFKHPEDWTRWKQCFQQFCVASGLSDAAAAKQISTQWGRKLASKNTIDE